MKKGMHFAHRLVLVIAVILAQIELQDWVIRVTLDLKTSISRPSPSRSSPDNRLQKITLDFPPDDRAQKITPDPTGIVNLTLDEEQQVSRFQELHSNTNRNFTKTDQRILIPESEKGLRRHLGRIEIPPRGAVLSITAKSIPIVICHRQPIVSVYQFFNCGAVFRSEVTFKVTFKVIQKFNTFQKMNASEEQIRKAEAAAEAQQEAVGFGNGGGSDWCSELA